MEEIIKHNYAVLKEVARVTFKEWAAYRSHMLLSLVVGPLQFFIQICIWRAVFHNRLSVKGFTLEDMITYYGLVMLIHYIIMDSADWNLQMLIRTGKFVTFILRPMDHMFFAFSQKVGHRLLGFMFEFIPVYLLFAILFKTYFIPVKPMWFLVSLCFSFCIFFLLNYCIGITGFWLIRTEGIRNMFRIFRSLLAGAFIPLSFFPGAIKVFLFFLPFQFVTYVPIQVFSGAYTLGDISLSVPEIVGIQGIALFIMYIVSTALYRLGIKKFTGMGT